MAEPLVVIDDWDEEQHYRDLQRKNPGKIIPRMRVGCTSVTRTIPPRDISRAVASNMGALRECYTQELERDASLSGPVDIMLRMGEYGVVEDVLTMKGIDGRGDFWGCLQRALEEVTVWPPPNLTALVSVAFELVPEPGPAAAGSSLQAARARLALLDTEGALAAFSSVIRGSGGGPDECWGRLGVLEIMLARAPWIDDPRVWAATQGFLRYGRGKWRRRQLAECFRAAAPVLSQVGTWPYFIPPEDDSWRYHRLGRFGSGAAGDQARRKARSRAKALLKLAPDNPARLDLLELATRVDARDGDAHAAARQAEQLLGQLAPKAAERLRHDLERASDDYDFHQERRDKPLRSGKCGHPRWR